MIHSGLVQYHDDLEALFVEIDSVQPHPENYNDGDIDEVATSIETNGMYRPIQVQTSTQYICVGNTTWAACKMLDATLIPVTWLHVDDEAAYRIMLTDNKTASLARPNPAQELALLEKLKSTEKGIIGTGYRERELENLQQLAQTELRSGVNGPSNLWPLMCVRVEPKAKSAYLAMTSEADTDEERFELLMRLAGWEG